MAGELDKVRSSAATLLDSVEVTRIVVVDDEYADRVEDLIGVCATIGGAQAASLPHLETIAFTAPPDVWAAQVRLKWGELNSADRRETVSAARRLPSVGGDASADGAPVAAEQSGDDMAAASLERILGRQGRLEFVPLSLGEWEERREEILADEKAPTTLLFFDRGYGEEREGTDDEGFALVRDAQSRGSGYCGLITHTVPVDAEYEAWRSMAEAHGLDRDRFVVVSKGRLNTEKRDYYGFLGMLRLTALSDRYAEVRRLAWSIFQTSLDEAKRELEELSVADFDRIVFASSLKEGVWEPDTLFRVFGILMRRAAGGRLHGDSAVAATVATARRVSAAPKQIAEALGRQGQSNAALRMQRYEIYDASDELNAWFTPLELGDIFRIGSDGKHCILLAQPCDLMVRRKGFRAHEDRFPGRMAAVAEIGRGENMEGMKWGEMPFFEADKGDSAFVNFARVHQVLLAVFDLCALAKDGAAAIDTKADCPDLLTVGWRKRFGKLQHHFDRALQVHGKLARAGLDEEAALALPGASATLEVDRTADGGTVRYGVTRVMRLRQPWSGALLTALAQYQSRAAFEHHFGYPAATS